MCPPFQYEPYSSRPYLSTISELMQESGRVQGRAAEIAGQAWGNALSEMGQNIGGAIQRATDPRLELERQQVATNKRAIAMTQTINGIVAQLTKQNPDGTRTLDRAKIQQQFAAANIPIQLQDQAFKALDDVDASIQKFNTLRTDHLADIAHAVLQNPQGATPEAFAFGAAMAKANGLVTEDQLQPIVEAIAQGADIKGLMSQVRGFSEKYKDQSKPVVLPRPGAQLVSPSGQPLATAPEAPQRPVNVPPGGKLVDPTSGREITTNPPAMAPSQTHNMRLKGIGDVPVDYVPNKDGSGGKWMYQGKDVTGQVAAIPPASIQVQNRIETDARNTAPVDASRPDPATANRIDPKLGLTPNAVYQGAVTFALENKLPAVTRSASPMGMAARNAVQNKAAAIAAAAGVDLPTVQAEYRANSAALSKLLPQAQATANFANTATDNLDLALRQSDQVARSGSKLVNRYVQWAQGELTPAKGLTQFETYVYTAAREYAKVTSGSAASAQGLTDSAQREASKLLNVAQSPDAFAAAVDAMKNDMANVTSEQAKGLARISSTIANFFSAANGGGLVQAGGSNPSPAPAPPAGTPRGGQRRVSVSSPGGKTYTFDDQAAADRFVADAKAKGLWR